ncbi:hypothetical protein BJP40_26840 [Streptomyces sp. CC53]|uniref:hypothetical protein n=1 Tax=unclassified Streptomyces TaxID=2593676 RepID=UPI0008DDCD42|nr:MULTISPECIES: hypothetical protein [unclassified Streptomyces]OII62858.1 hypothetical protein BJP40_26840 [Streptomyces sp. CC53]OII67904.1 hypothetical protein BJP39_23195 [Streptomyces sp. CC77]
MATKRMAPQGFSEQVSALVKALRTETPDCVASGVVDMATGMLLSYETVDSHPPEVLDLLAGATLDLFQGRTVVLIEDVFKERRGVDNDQHFFQEILVNSDNLTHLFIRMNDSQDVVAVVVCRKSVNVGMLFAQARRVVKEYGGL